MSDTNKNKNRAAIQPAEQDYFHGAAIVLSDGQEVPITEAMVQHALTTLEQQCHEVSPRLHQLDQH